MNGPIDECVADLKTVVKAWQDQAADVIDIKISKFGGLTKVLKDFFYLNLISQYSRSIIFVLEKTQKVDSFNLEIN